MTVRRHGEASRWGVTVICQGVAQVRECGHGCANGCPCYCGHDSCSRCGCGCRRSCSLAEARVAAAMAVPAAAPCVKYALEQTLRHLEPLGRVGTGWVHLGSMWSPSQMNPKQSGGRMEQHKAKEERLGALRDGSVQRVLHATPHQQATVFKRCLPHNMAHNLLATPAAARNTTNHKCTDRALRNRKDDRFHDPCFQTIEY